MGSPHRYCWQCIIDPATFHDTYSTRGQCWTLSIPSSLSLSQRYTGDDLNQLINLNIKLSETLWVDQWCLGNWKYARGRVFTLGELAKATHHNFFFLLLLFYLESWLLKYYQHTTDFLSGASGWVTFKQKKTSTVEDRGHHLISTAKSWVHCSQGRACLLGSSLWKKSKLLIPCKIWGVNSGIGGLSEARLIVL